MSKTRPIVKRRGSSWVVDYGRRRRPDGTSYRERKSYKTRAAASAAITKRGVEDQNHDIRLFHLTDAERLDVLASIGKLDGRATLVEAVDYFLEHGCPASGPRALSDVLAEYIVSKANAGRRPRTVRDAQGKMRAMIAGLGKEFVHEITTIDVEQWLDRQGFTPPTRNSYRTAAKTFFSYCKKRKYRSDNPVLAISAVAMEAPEPEVMDVADVKRLLVATEEHCPELVPYVALSFFTGLRSAEMQHLQWEQVSLKNRIVTVTAQSAKKRRRRHVDISDNLLAWITPYYTPTGPIYYSRKHLDRVRRLARVHVPRNAHRHSYASFHLAMYENAAKTSLQLGHRDPDVLFTNYRGITTTGGAEITKEVAERYWSIMPKHAAKVIHLPA